jgi:hypothetical protein
MASASASPSDWTITPWGVGIGLVAGAYAFSWAFFYLSHDAKEPPLAPLTVPIPFIGYMIEMYRKRAKFPAFIRCAFSSLPTFDVIAGIDVF